MAVLNRAATMTCPHQGVATVAYSPNNGVYVEGALALTKDDAITITGCTFTNGSQPSPCVRVVWKASHAAAKASSNLVSDSHTAMCVNTTGVEQGALVIIPAATKVIA